MNLNEYLAIADAIQYFKREEKYDEATMEGVIEALVEPLSKHYPDFCRVQFLNDTEVTEVEV
jgi:hypothetical protein